MAKFCFNCGAKLEENNNFCASCGSKLNETVSNQTSGFQTQAQPMNNNTYTAAGKSRMVAGLLGLFLGYIGVHNFYLGFTGKAILQIILTVVTCGIAGIWGFIEGILILAGNINTDADGNRLAD
jgi:TM2 domain-containing membrane protein YozV